MEKEERVDEAKAPGGLGRLGVAEGDGRFEVRVAVPLHLGGTEKE